MKNDTETEEFDPIFVDFIERTFPGKTWTDKFGRFVNATCDE